ncbi:MAG TPA: hypothetical protein VM032_05070 [Vicinamibacterales bacterium]|nr:hypothetical protein [Vicinamibacterales bacterium]
MEPLAEMLATNERQALEFFLVGLKDVSDGDVDQQELLYNASVLAHYAQVSTQAHGDLPTPATLGAVFDQFVLDSSMHADSSMLETAGTQCLLLSGFFETQMRRRHNIRWYTDLGSGFFRSAARLARERRRAELLDTLGRHFEPWRVRYSRLSHELQAQRYLIRPSQN